MQIKINVEGYGTFQIESDKVLELLAWLSKNQGVRINEQNTVREVQNNVYTGRDLLSEETINDK